MLVIGCANGQINGASPDNNPVCDGLRDPLIAHVEVILSDDNDEAVASLEVVTAKFDAGCP